MPASLGADMSVYSLVMQASLPVQVVMGILLLTSIISWFTIFMKMAELSRAKKQADEFEKAFWSGGDMNKLYQGRDFLRCLNLAFRNMPAVNNLGRAQQMVIWVRVVRCRWR